jgi:hypothetical protein
MAFIYDNIKIGIIDVVLFTFSLFFALLPRKNTIFAMCFRRNTDFLLNSPVEFAPQQRERRAGLNHCWSMRISADFTIDD